MASASDNVESFRSMSVKVMSI